MLPAVVMFLRRRWCREGLFCLAVAPDSTTTSLAASGHRSEVVRLAVAAAAAAVEVEVEVEVVVGPQKVRYYYLVCVCRRLVIVTLTRRVTSVCCSGAIVSRERRRVPEDVLRA
jgi:hypothetical protein